MTLNVKLHIYVVSYESGRIIILYPLYIEEEIPFVVLTGNIDTIVDNFVHNCV